VLVLPVLFSKLRTGLEHAASRRPAATSLTFPSALGGHYDIFYLILTLIDVDAQIIEVLIKRRGGTLYRNVYEFLSFSYLPSINSLFTSCGKGFVFMPGVDTSVSRELL
jgi:hypothetical protein